MFQRVHVCEYITCMDLCLILIGLNVIYYTNYFIQKHDFAYTKHSKREIKKSFRCVNLGVMKTFAKT